MQKTSGRRLLDAAAIPHLLLKDRHYSELYKGIRGLILLGSVFRP